jgi:S1-C subfamily serine protease
MDQVVEEMFTSSSERILHSFYRQKIKPTALEQSFQEVGGTEAAEVDVFDFDASFFAEDRSMGLTIKDVLIMMCEGDKPKQESRVQVVAVDAGSPGDLEGIEPGDILLSINGISL